MLAALTDLNITGWPDSTQVVPEDLHPYWCFRDELTILDRLVMKENRVVIPSSMETPIACMTHIRVSAQRSNVQVTCSRLSVVGREKKGEREKK